MERLVIFIIAIFFNNGHNGVLRNKTGKIVDVAVGVVAGDAVAEPENLTNAEIIAKTLFDFAAAQIGITIFVQ